MTDENTPGDEPIEDNPETPETPQEPFEQGNIVDLAIDRELHDSYLTYAMSTIMDHALPDVRDGLKPSQRRILVAMNDLNLGPRSKHRKCSKICGDTSGNYHPHGDPVVYPTLVGMAQDFKMSSPLIDPQGNFGSIDGDPPAAMRYTEARLAAPAMEMLNDLKLSTVDFQENYDNTRLEPMVLPSKFPNLLVNGGTGIAVGMATSLPPHNPGEICDGIIACIDNPEIELMELLKLIPGPDFPTGGAICGRSGILRGYATGRGRLIVRARTHFEPMKNGKTQIVVTEIPNHILKTTIIDQIVEAVKNERITDIADVNDYSGRDGMRLVIETKKGVDPEVVLNQLWRYSSLQTTFSLMNIVLVNRQPRTLSLKEMIRLFIDHRMEVITRRTQHLLQKAQQEAHLKEGLIYAVCDIDEVIRLIRSSSTRDEAIEKLMERGFQIPADHPHAPLIPQRLKDQAASSPEGMIKLSRAQAEAIGRMQLISLVGLEIEKLARDYAELVDEIEGYEFILSDEKNVLAIVREDTVEIKDKYSVPRRTTIEDAEAEDVDMGDLIPVEKVAVTISHSGYVKRLPIEAYRTQARGGRGVIGADTKDEDFTEHVFVSSTHDDLLCFTNTGRVFKMKVYEIPQASRTSRGFLVSATEKGLVKRTSLKLYRNVNRSGLIAVTLKDGDRLVDVRITSGSDHLMLCTGTGLSIRFDENDVRAMGRSASGVKGIALAHDDKVVAMVKADDSRQLLTVCVNGYGKRTPMGEYLVQPEEGEPYPQRRGGKGRVDIKATARNGAVVTALSINPDDQMMLITEKGMIVRTSIADVRQTGRATQGVRVINLKKGDKLISVARIADTPEATTPEATTSEASTPEASENTPPPAPPASPESDEGTGETEE
jgi:DNA gyrase subunit A